MNPIQKLQHAKCLRAQEGLSYRAIGERLGVDNRMVWEWINRRTGPRSPARHAPNDRIFTQWELQAWGLMAKRPGLYTQARARQIARRYIRICRVTPFPVERPRRSAPERADRDTLAMPPSLDSLVECVPCCTLIELRAMSEHRRRVHGG